MQRNLSLDIYKLILSFFIVAIHMQPLFENKAEIYGWLIGEGVGRVSIANFFIINIYFLLDKILDKKKLFNYIKHFIIIYLVWSTLYYLIIYPGAPIRDVIKNYIIGYHHLWYISALIFATLLYSLLKKIIRNNYIIYALAILLFFIGFYLEASKSYLEEYRNGLFLGFPFIVLGNSIYKYDLKSKINNNILLFTIIVSFILSLIESYIYLQKLIVADFFISSIIFCPAILIYLLKRKTIYTSKPFYYYFGHLSACIYYIHMFFVLYLILPDYNIMRLPLVFGLSLLASLPIIYLNKHIKIFL